MHKGLTCQEKFRMEWESQSFIILCRKSKSNFTHLDYASIQKQWTVYSMKVILMDVMDIKFSYNFIAFAFIVYGILIGIKREQIIAIS